MQRKLIYLIIILVLGFGTLFYFFNLWMKNEAHKMDISREKLNLENEKIVKQSTESLKKLEPWEPLGNGQQTTVSKSAYLDGIGPITNIDCSQINRSDPNSERPIAYLNGVPLNGILQPNSKIQQVMSNACRS